MQKSDLICVLSKTSQLYKSYFEKDLYKGAEDQQWITTEHTIDRGRNNKKSTN